MSIAQLNRRAALVYLTIKVTLYYRVGSLLYLSILLYYGETVIPLFFTLPTFGNPSGKNFISINFPYHVMSNHPMVGESNRLLAVKASCGPLKDPTYGSA